MAEKSLQQQFEEQIQAGKDKLYKDEIKGKWWAEHRLNLANSGPWIEKVNKAGLVVEKNHWLNERSRYGSLLERTIVVELSGEVHFYGVNLLDIWLDKNK